MQAQSNHTYKAHDHVQEQQNTYRLYKNERGGISKQAGKQQATSIQEQVQTTLTPLCCPFILSSLRRLYGAQYGSSEDPILARTPS